MMIVAVTGDRGWPPDRYPEVRAALATLDPTLDRVILGDAMGVDELAYHACIELGLAYTVHTADWGRYRRAAGPIRNRAMLDDLTKLTSDSMWADREVWYFHDDLECSKGTRNMVGQARERELTVRNGAAIAGKETA